MAPMDAGKARKAAADALRGIAQAVEDGRESFDRYLDMDALRELVDSERPTGGGGPHVQEGGGELYLVHRRDPATRYPLQAANFVTSRRFVFGSAFGPVSRDLAGVDVDGEVGTEPPPGADLGALDQWSYRLREGDRVVRVIGGQAFAYGYKGAPTSVPPRTEAAL